MGDDTSTIQETKKNETTEETFKKPLLIGRIGKLPKKVKKKIKKMVNNALEKASLSPKKPKKPYKIGPEPKLSIKSASRLVSKEVPVSYKEPEWSGLCPNGTEYMLEVLKSGMITEHVDLTRQSYYVFGRRTNCDVMILHPSISRHHCVLQYKAFTQADEPAPGWYLYDLGSSHGTYLNKCKVMTSHYTRVHVGHQIKFAGCKWTYILTGPDFDCEGESELSVTEIKERAKEMKIKRDRMIQEAKEQMERLEEERKREEQFIDWGMGDDAKNVANLSENSFGVTIYEQLYLSDPKKTLRGFFEREGLELCYDCEERGQRQYICKVELPINDARGRPVIAQAIHTGKKKEAVIACALEACRILDRAGLLRQAKHESRRRKERDWSADDYYASDDDNYLDRTGQVERKRQNRMLKHGALPNEGGAPTYEQLQKQISDLESKIKAEERRLEGLRESIKMCKQTDSEEDDLDVYMATLTAPSMNVKAEISNSKITLQKLRGELSKTQRLAELARPAHLTPLIKNDGKRLKITNSVVYGKRIKLKTDKDKKSVPKQVSRREEEFVEEVDTDGDDFRIKEDTEPSKESEKELFN